MNERVDSPVLTLYVRRPTPQGAARLKSFIGKRGWRLLDRSAPPEPLPLEVRYVVLPGPRGSYTAVWPSEPDLHPDELGALLSRSLQAEVVEVVLGPGGSPFAYRRLANGAASVELAIVAGQTLERRGADAVTRAIDGGATALEALEGEGMRFAGVPWSDLSSSGLPPRERPVAVRFLPAQGDAGQSIGIDPLLECPTCKGPMIERQGKFGPFFGCAQFPACRGRLTAVQAEAQRKSALEV